MTNHDNYSGQAMDLTLRALVGERQETLRAHSHPHDRGRTNRERWILPFRWRDPAR